MSGLVKRLREYGDDPQDVSLGEIAEWMHKSADRIEQLERELDGAVEAHKVELILRMKAQRNLQAARGKLAAEKALADTLHKGVELWERAAPNSSAEAEASSYGSSARAAYRKARGL